MGIGREGGANMKGGPNGKGREVVEEGRGGERGGDGRGAEPFLTDLILTM